MAREPTAQTATPDKASTFTDLQHANTALQQELAAQIAKYETALAREAALAEVFDVINASAGDLAPVFNAILEQAMRLCGISFGRLNRWDGTSMHVLASRGLPPALADFIAQNPVQTRPGPLLSQMLETQRPVFLLDTREGEGYRAGFPVPRALVDLGGVRTNLLVPLLQGSTVIGYFNLFRQEVRAFSEPDILLLQNVAAQAVIAMENARLLGELRSARDTAETSLIDLRHTQDRLVQTEKMASLGQLTAGIAHEIKNPLNFVNNFSDLSVDLLAELNAAVAPENLPMPPALRAEIDDLTSTLTSNLQKIIEHGKRADSIVKNMLLHSRSGTSERRAVDLNATADEALNLAYHGTRAEKPSFNITLERDFDPTIGMLEIYPQEIARVLVNLINNGFYAAHQRAQANPGFEPILRLSTKNLGDQVAIRVRDNGAGIPAAMRDKIFEPFFTTKPAGEGTGLGLSLSFDIIVKQHGGQLAVDSQAGAFTEFTIILPRPPPAAEGKKA